jgi:hypothetical protein
MSADDFYVGYRRRAPPTLARFVGGTAALLVAAGAALAGLLASRQGPFDPGVFEFGVLRSFDGIVRERPYPLLEVGLPGLPGGAAGRRTGYYLGASGKRGASREVEGLDGRRVRVSGSLVHRDDQAMIEVAAGSATSLGGAALAPPAGEELGVFRLAGEIVDAKCYLGVMKPGRTKPHRDCAVRCLSGGLPPLFVVEDRAGRSLQLLLVDEDGGPVGRRVLDRVAEPIEITGRVRRLGGTLLLAADPATYRRLE